MVLTKLSAVLVSWVHEVSSEFMMRILFHLDHEAFRRNAGLFRTM